MITWRAQNVVNFSVASSASWEALAARTVASRTRHGRVTCRTTWSPVTVQIPAGTRET